MTPPFFCGYCHTSKSKGIPRSYFREGVGGTNPPEWDLIVVCDICGDIIGITKSEQVEVATQ